MTNETRPRYLMLLLDHRELRVCEITHAPDIAQPNVSCQLAKLREAALVCGRREGLWIHYRLDPALPDWVVAESTRPAPLRMSRGPTGRPVRLSRRQPKLLAYASHTRGKTR